MEKTTKALLLIAKMATKVSNDLADDGKIDLMEGVGLGMTALGFIGVFKDLKAIKEELKSFDEVQKDALVKAFDEAFQLPNVDLEGKIEAGIELLLTLYLYIEGNAVASEVAAIKAKVLGK